MDKIFLEEQGHLEKTLNNLERKISYLEENKPFPQISKYAVGYDKDVRDNLLYQKSRNNKSEEEIKYYDGFKSSPYFARMDFNINDSYEKIYIGKKSLTIDGNQIVYDWRSDVGKRYYLKNETNFRHNQYIYELLLRRALNVKDGKLISYFNEYSIDDIETKGQVSDPFLIKILREKRQEHRLTDIIRTIQQNQNEIINFSKDKSFVVQGCAGSGKTMIMLHRLSYLKFNYPELDLSRIKVLTPNEGFTTFINDLSIELELEKIQRITVEDYYIYLLHQYNPNLCKEKSDCIEDTKLSTAFIKEIYSSTFIKRCEEAYKKHIEGYYKIFKDTKLINIINNSVLTDSILKNNEYESIKLFISHLENLIIENEQNKRKLEQLQLEVQRLEEYMEGLKNNKLNDQENNKIEDDFNFRTYNDPNSKNKELLYLNIEDFQALKELKSQLENISFFNILKRNNLKSQIRFIENRSKSNKELYETRIKQKEPIIDDLLELDKNVSKLNASKIKHQQKIINEKRSEFNKLSLNILDNAKIEHLKGIIENVKLNFNAESIYKNTYGKLLGEKAKEYNINYSINTYRHNIYLYLEFYSSFAGKVPKNDLLINIDEGQDLSSSEYKLLKKVNGDRAVFNIYGDLNQLINSKGIKNWSDIDLTNKIFELKENYRNTIEITNFCNTELGYNNISIGLSGNTVKIINLDMAIKQLQNHLNKYTKSRYAVIVTQAEEKLIKEYIDKGRISKGKLSVLTIDESKGLEFDSVFVFDKNMAKNERYIAYTRALNELVIIR